MKLWKAIKAWWQSFHESTQISPMRTRLGHWWSNRAPDPNDANDERSRQESIRLSHWMEINEPLAIRLARIFVQYTVGGGLRVKAASSDPDWNVTNQSKWDLWCKMPDLTSVQDFDSFQVMVAWRTFFDGGGYILKTRGDSSPYFPRLQFIEAMNIQTPPSLVDRKNIFDGKETDGRGRIIAYYARQVVNGEESFRRIDASAIIPICDFNRPGELHSFPYLDPVLNLLRDLRDLRKLAMDKAKEAAETKNVYKTETRQLPDAERMRQARLTGSIQLKDGTEVSKQIVQMMDDKFGGKNIAIGTNESVEQLASISPNEIEQAHYRIILGEICAGMSIPTMLVSPESIQGTVSRAVLDDFALFVKSQSTLFQRAFDECYRYVTSQHIAIDSTLARAPKDWWRCSIRPPRAPNVDRGRDMNALLGALEAGGATLDDFFVPLGLDTEEQIARGFQILKFIKQQSDLTEVPAEWFMRAIAQATKDAIDKEQKAQAEEDAQQKAAA